MADDRSRESWRGRAGGSSIFGDDDDSKRGERGGGRDWNPEDYGWGSRSERGGEGAGRGFFDRAKDEVRSWLGDDDERGRGGRRGWSERSGYGSGQSGFGGETYRSNRSSPSGGGYAGRENSGTSHFDENYRRWRDQQIARLDQEYEDYCRERQQRFETDFDSWRQSRQAGTGQAEATQGPGSGAAASGRSAILGDDSAGAATAGGGGASAMEASTGSAPEGDNETGGRGRG